MNGAEPPTAAGASATLPWFKRWSGAIGRARGVIGAVAAVGAILGGAAGYLNAYRAVHGLAAPAGGPASGVQPTDAGPLSIVVLPFANLTGDPAQAYVADGLTASVTADLSRIADAFVVGTGTALTFRDKALTAQQVGQELGVRFVLQGSVQRSGGKIRINAQLNDTATNAQLWSETFDGDSSDIFALQDQVTALIGNSMGRELVVRAARESERHASDATVADLLLRARALQIRPQSLANWQQVEALCRRALALEPANVEATVLLAKSLALQASSFWHQLGISGWVRDVAEATELSARIRDANSATDDPGLHEVLGLVAQLHGDFDGALRAYERRLALQPKSPVAYVELAQVRYLRAEPQPALELLKQALALDPRHPVDVLLIYLAAVEFMLGDADAAIDWSLKARAANPAWSARFPTLAMAYALKGDRARASAAAAAAFKADPTNTVSGAMHQLDFSLVPTHPAFRAWALQHRIPAMRLAGFPE